MVKKLKDDIYQVTVTVNNKKLTDTVSLIGIKAGLDSIKDKSSMTYQLYSAQIDAIEKTLQSSEKTEVEEKVTEAKKKEVIE